MIRCRTILTLALCLAASRGAIQAQQQTGWTLEALNDQGWWEYDGNTHTARATNGVIFRSSAAVVTADEMTINDQTGEIVADGMVRILREGQIWAGEHIRYNINTHQMEAQQFRTGKPPIFATGHDLHGEITNRVYLVATNAFVTTDDIDNPAVRIRAKRLTIVPGQKVEAQHATLYVGDVPVFYFPYYTRNLGPRANNFNFIPGYRTSWGPFILGSYVFFLNQQLDGIMHTDYREKRGFGGGPDLNYHLGQWGSGTLKYYYLYDQAPNTTYTNSIPYNRQRINFNYQATPATNLTVKSIVRYQSDPYVVKEFFEGEYRQDPQPNTYVDVNKYWQNFSVDMNVQPRLNDFLETIEQLPDVRMSAFRQQLGPTPFYYESESSAGYYRHLFPVTNGPPIGLEYEASRFDTYHQLLLPETFFGWLNVIPHVGGRYTYYSAASGPGATTEEVNRGVLDTGAQVNFKASRLWPGAENQFLEVDGLRHIIEPRVEYMYVPKPNAVGTNVIPQFTYQLPSLRLLPIDYPDYNSIDSITSQNVVRYGLNNKLQTKRDGKVVNLVNWDVYTDWNLRPLGSKTVAQDGLSLQPQTTFSDIFSDLTIKPRSWLTLESLTTYNLDPRQFFGSLTTITIEPNQTWSWSLGQYYIANDPNTNSPTSLGLGNNLFASTFYYRLNENWGLRAAHRYNFKDSIMEEQDYAIYRDLRSWTVAITFRLRKSEGSPNDFTAALTFSLKAFPRYGLGTDALRPAWLLGS